MGSAQSKSLGGDGEPKPQRSFRCPICRRMQGVRFALKRGLYLLCDGCLGMLLIDELRTADRLVVGVRPLGPDDIASVPSDVYLAILEEKTIRMRKRREAGKFIAYRDPADVNPTRIEPFEDHDAT